MDFFQTARVNMVKNQLMPNGVHDTQLLEVIEGLPREQFVNDNMKDAAYVDMELNLGEGRFLLKPEIIAKMIQLAKITNKDKVLDIAAGTGYATAIISQICREIIAVESVSSLITKAKKLFASLKLENAILVQNEVLAGNPTSAPYDVIIVSGGALKKEPTLLLEQLSNNGGRLIAAIMNEKNVVELMLFEKNDGIISSLRISNASVSTI